MKNKCNSNCPCFWSDYSDYTGDGDYGCLMRIDALLGGEKDACKGKN